jgi:lipoprotein-anchoring transpeptidase ErfK/SrfK
MRHLALAVVLLAVPVAPALAENLRSPMFARLAPQPQLSTMPSYRDPWGGLRHVLDVVRYEAPTSEPTSEMDPRFFRRVIDYSTQEKPGSIVIDTRGRYLYYVEGRGKATRYDIGVGRPGFAWSGTKQVSAKRVWPEWRPPTEMLLRRPDLPVHMAGGPANPLGARAIYLGSSLYRIHGSNEPDSIGQAVSSGCFRMRNGDVIDLYDRVKVGTRVVVI